MTLSNRNVLSIIECIFYVPVTVLSLFLCIRHCCRGAKSQIGWIFFYLYCHVRVAESALGLASIGSSNVAVYSTSILFSLIGVPLLLNTTLGLLNRVQIEGAKNENWKGIKPWWLAILQIPFTASLVLCARGATNSTVDISGSNGSSYQPQIMTKIGVALGIVGFLVMVLLTGAMLRRKEYADSSSRHLLHAITISLPFLFIRLVYTVLVTFWNKWWFKSFDGNVEVIALMAVAPEMVVVMIYIVEGFILERLPKDFRKKKSQRKRGGWPSEQELLDDVSITRENTTSSEAQHGKDFDDRSSGSFKV